MSPRPLTQFEIPYANQVVRDGTLKGWEYAAFLASSSGPLIAYATSNSSQYVNLPPSVQSARTAGTTIVVHHNHLSQESLSCDDWNGLANGFAESFAHCADGTVYWGTVADRDEVLRFCPNQKIQMEADNVWAATVPHTVTSHPSSQWVAGFFGREVLNRAMHIRGFVKYGYLWGSKPVSPHGTVYGPTGLTGQHLNALLHQAAAQLTSIL